MKTVSCHIREHFLKRNNVIKSDIDIQRLRQTEWSSDFEKFMRNRLVIGAFRYGKIHAKTKSQYNRISSAIKRLELYNQSGNLEYLVDVANLCLLEFEESSHPNKHFNSIDDGEHVRTK